MQERAAVIDTVMQYVGGIAPPVLLALLGGAVRVLRGPGQCSLRYVAATMASAAFTGLLTHKGLSSMPGIPEGILTAIVGISGYAGGKLLDILTERLCRVAATGKPPLPKV